MFAWLWGDYESCKSQVSKEVGLWPQYSKSEIIGLRLRDIGRYLLSINCCIPHLKSLSLDDGRLFLHLHTLDYATNIVAENEAHFVSECPLYNSITIKLQSQFENVVLGSLKSSFQFDHQGDSSLYLMEITALRQPRVLAVLAPSWYTGSPFSLMASNQLHFLY